MDAADTYHLGALCELLGILQTWTNITPRIEVASYAHAHPIAYYL